MHGGAADADALTKTNDTRCGWVSRETNQTHIGLSLSNFRLDMAQTLGCNYTLLMCLQFAEQYVQCTYSNMTNSYAR